jgi:hypothetical protein
MKKPFLNSEERTIVEKYTDTLAASGFLLRLATAIFIKDLKKTITNLIKKENGKA